MLINLKIKHVYTWFDKLKFLKLKNCIINQYILKNDVCPCVFVRPSVCNNTFSTIHLNC